MSISLRPVSRSDQRFPCSISDDNKGDCTVRASFALMPSCTHDTDTWPDTQACTKHLSAAVKLASARCAIHMTGKVVRVRPL